MSFDDESVGAVLDAVAFAARKHRDQRRKDVAAAPYVNHAIEVVEVLWRVGGVRDPITLIGGLLHDTIEDTDTTAEEIRARFGDEVAAVVVDVTDDKRLPSAERKRLQVETAPHKPDRAREIKLADKICNVRDLARSAPVGWSRDRQLEYVEWARRVVDGLRDANSALAAYFDEVAARARARIET